MGRCEYRHHGYPWPEGYQREGAVVEAPDRTPEHHDGTCREDNSVSPTASDQDATPKRRNLHAEAKIAVAILIMY